jgi:hypothetical protein
MRITSYSFGRITVDGKTYAKDVIILPGRVLSPWWRLEGHYLQPADLDEVIKARPDLLIVGTGASGVMKVPPETVQFLGGKGIIVEVLTTSKAVEKFNKSPKDSTVVAALHLTC